MAIVRCRPTRDIFAVQDDMNRMLDSFFGEIRGDDGAMLAPPVDVSENNDNFVVTAELPGLKKDEIKITIQNNVLTITGSKKKDSESREDLIHRVERSFGSFCRTVSFPAAVDQAKIDADFKDGILTISVPKVEEARPKEITIRG